VFHRSSAVTQSMAWACFVGAASGSFSHGTRVSNEDRGDERTIGGNRWRNGIFGLDLSQVTLYGPICESKPAVVDFVVVQWRGKLSVSRKGKTRWPVKAKNAKCKAAVRLNGPKISVTGAKPTGASRSEVIPRAGVWGSCRCPISREAPGMKPLRAQSLASGCGRYVA
jgi:hypothetical protein